MRTEVEYAGQPAGWIEWEQDAFGVQASLDCAVPDEAALLRCYGRTAGEPLLVGLPEPIEGRLRLTRHLSRETLKAAGCAEHPPEGFYLSETAQPAFFAAEKALPDDSPPEPAHGDPAAERTAPAAVHTGDEVLDALLASGTVAAALDGGAVELRCPFSSDEPFALAPGFALCRVENGQAILRYEKKNAAR